MNHEKKWIKKVQRNGDEASANRLVSKYYKEMYAFVYKQTLDAELSLDLTQELFITVLKSIHHYDAQKAAFRTWLYKVASNRLIDYYRSKSYRYTTLTEQIEDDSFEDGMDVEVTLEYKEDYERVASLVNDLNVNVQQIVRLKLFGEYTFQEIAELEKLAESTVKSRYYTALKRIRKGMEAVYDA